MDKRVAIDLLQGGKIKEWNEYRSRNGGWYPDLMDADLRGLVGHVKDGSTTVAVNLEDAKLCMANLEQADLMHAQLRGADLRSACLRDSVLIAADLDRSRLGGADLTGATLGLTSLFSSNFYWARNLKDAKFIGPCDVGLSDLLEPDIKRVPSSFLGGCGVHPSLISIIHGSTEERTEAFYDLISDDRPIRFDSCFISFTFEDKEFVDRLQHALQESGPQPWYAPVHGQWGRSLAAQIKREIRRRDRLVVVCSEQSLFASEWVREEIEEAFAEEDRRREAGERNWRVVFPVMIDDALERSSDPLHKRVKEVLAADFRKAREGLAFHKAIKRLVEALQKSNADQGDDA